MSTERRQRARQIFASVADLTAGRRQEALRQACGGDHDLCAAVERLLEEHDRMDGDETLLSPGEVLSERFRVRRILGRGGMGEVYLCDDIALGQPVALKALRPQGRRRADSAERFKREIQIARRVTHPNVCRVFDLGRYEKGPDSIDFFTMEFVDGETLADYLDREGPLSPDQARPLIEQMAAGLAALHDRQIVHRDLKPGNILLERLPSGDRRVVLTDFGIAGTIGARERFGSFATVSGQIMGTPEYMAPEQLTGLAAGPATDLFSLGVVLYQMLTGQKPFPDDNFRTAAPVPPRFYDTNIPPDWERLILECLEPDLTKRPQSAGAVLAALGNVPQRFDPSSAPTIAFSRAQPKRRLAVVAGIVVGALALAAAGIRYVGRGPVAEDARRVAVLPFVAAAGEPGLQPLADGLMDTITSRLSQYEGLNEELLVVPSSEVRRNGVEHSDMARGALGVNYAVEGRLSAQGDRVRLTLTLIDAENMIQRETTVINGFRSKALDLEDDAVTRLATLLDLHALPDQVESVASVSPGAQEFYLQGKGYIQRSDELESVNDAIQLFTKAIALDPNYARAYAGLSQAYLYKQDRTEDPVWVTRAEEASLHAVELSPQLLEAQTARGHALLAQGRPEEALAIFESALERNPRSADAYAGMAKSYADQADNATGQDTKTKLRKEAESAYLKAISLRPNDWVAYKRLGLFYVDVGRPLDAIKQYKIIAELAPDNAHAYSNLGILYHMVGNDEESKRYLEKTIEIDPNRVSAMTNLAMLLSDEGRLESAAAMYERAVEKNPKSDNAWANLASVQVKLGRKAESERAYRRAIELVEHQAQIEGGSPETDSSLAHHYAGLGELEKSIEYARKAVSSDNASVQINLAIAFSKAGDATAARTALEKAIEGGYPIESARRIESLKDLLPVSGK